MRKSSNRFNQPEFISKKDHFRQQIRREQLGDYFSKKRADCFGWSQSKFLGEENEHIAQIRYYEFDDGELFESENEIQFEKKPQYNENYFIQTNLLQKMIQIKYPEENPNDFSIEAEQTFVYPTLYSFMIEVIKQSLDPKYFQKFSDNQNFLGHFNALKLRIFHKLNQEIEHFAFLYDLGNLSFAQENLSKEDNQLKKTYWDLIVQLANWMEPQSLETEQDREWPLISVGDQLIFLLQCFISITYFDKPVKTEDVFEVIEKMKVNRYCEKYSETFNLDQEYQNEQSSEKQSLKKSSILTSATHYLVQEGNLVNRLKNLIVYGHGEHSLNTEQGQIYQTQQFERNPKIQKQAKCKQLDHIILLLLNISFNLGSDILFEKGIISELKCLLSQPFQHDLFKVNIRRNSRQVLIPLVHQKIVLLILTVIEQIKSGESIQYLRDADCLAFAYNCLIDVTKAKDQLENMVRPRKENHLSIGNQFLLVESRNQQDESQNQQEESRNEQEDTLDFDPNQDQKKQKTKQTIKIEKEIHRLTYLAQTCIKNIDFQLTLLQFYEKHKQYFTQTTQIYHINYKPGNSLIIKLYTLINNSLQAERLQSYDSWNQLLNKWQITKDQ